MSVPSRRTSALPPKSGHVQCTSRCPLSAKSGTHAPQQTGSLLSELVSSAPAVGVGGSAPAQSFFAVLAYLANMVLGVKLKAKLGNEVELGFEEIDVVLLIRHQQFEQIARHIIPG